MAGDGGRATGSAISDCRRLHLDILCLQHGIPRWPNYRRVLSRGKQRAGREGFGRLVGGMSAKGQIWICAQGQGQNVKVPCITPFFDDFYSRCNDKVRHVAKVQARLWVPRPRARNELSQK